MSHSDSAFFKTFGVVIGALVLFTLFCIVVANMLSPGVDYSNDPVVQGALRDRVGAVGKSRIAAPPAQAESAAEPQAEEVQQASKPADEPSTQTEQVSTDETKAPEALAVANSQVTGAEDFDVKVRAVVATNCAGCHEKGVTGAQRLDDSVSWNKLADKGIDELTASVINGKGAMPPRAESDLDDEQLREAVRYTLFLAGASAGAEGAGAQPAQPAAPAAPAAQTQTVAAAEVPQDVKTAVDTICAACHSTGVANAPKFGDKAAWDARMAEGGMDALLANSIAGKGGMPPRGGTNLTDEQLKLAIGYIIAK